MFSSLFKRIFLICLISLTTSAQASHHVDTSNPYLMIKGAAQDTFDRFQQDKTKIEADKNYLKVIVEEDLMPYVDDGYAGLKVMGRYVRQATPEQRKAFVAAFRAYMITTYAQAFTAYRDQQVEFEPARKVGDEKQVQVDVKVVQQGKPDLKIAFKARRLKDDSWKVFDLVAEGVSLLRSKTSEFDALFRKQSIDDVIALLKVKATESIHDDSIDTN